MAHRPDLERRFAQAIAVVKDNQLWPDLEAKGDPTPSGTRITVSNWLRVDGKDADGNQTDGGYFACMATIWIPRDGPFTKITKIFDWQADRWGDRTEGIVNLMRVRAQSAVERAVLSWVRYQKQWGKGPSPKRDTERMARTAKRLSFEQSQCLLCHRLTNTVYVYVVPEEQVTPKDGETAPYEARQMIFHRLCPVCQKTPAVYSLVAGKLDRIVTKEALTYGMIL